MILIEGKRKPVQPETLADELKQKQLAAARPWTGQDGRIHQYVFPGSVAEQEMQKNMDMVGKLGCFVKHT